MLGTATVLYLIFATGPIPHFLLRSLEFKYPTITDELELKGIATIVVLAGYARDDSNVPVIGRVNGASSLRLMEALRLSRSYPNKRIIITGYGAVPRVMRSVLIALGVQEYRILIDTQARNTFESAHNLQTLLTHDPFLLVTSAGHAPRAMGVFERLSMRPVPALTDYRTSKNWREVDYLPSADHLVMSDLAIHEYLGIAWYYFHDRL